MMYPPSVSTQLNKLKAEKGYTSRFWVTTAELESIRKDNKLTLKEGEQPNKVYESDRSESPTEMYNNDQFTDPYFIKLYAQLCMLQTKKVNEKDIRWKTIAKKLREASQRRS